MTQVISSAEQKQTHKHGEETCDCQQGVAGERSALVFTEQVTLSIGLLNSSSAEFSLCEHSHGIQISSHSPPSHSGRSIHTVFPRLSSPPNSSPSKSLTVQPMNQCAFIHLAISPSKQNKQLSALVELLPTGSTPLHGCPSGLSQRGCSFPAVHFWWDLHVLQNLLESRPKEKSWVN